MDYVELKGTCGGTPIYLTDDSRTLLRSLASLVAGSTEGMIVWNTSCESDNNSEPTLTARQRFSSNQSQDAQANQL